VASQEECFLSVEMIYLVVVVKEPEELKVEALEEWAEWEVWEASQGFNSCLEACQEAEVVEVKDNDEWNILEVTTMKCSTENIVNINKCSYPIKVEIRNL